MAQGRRPDAASLAALSAWAGLNPSDFVQAPYKTHRPEAMAQISTLLRADPNLDTEGAEAIEAIVRTAYERLRKARIASFLCGLGGVGRRHFKLSMTALGGEHPASLRLSDNLRNGLLGHLTLKIRKCTCIDGFEAFDKLEQSTLILFHMFSRSIVLLVEQLACNRSLFCLRWTQICVHT